ncbi:glycosyl transferase family A [Alkalihalophilus pseudofirmus]|nr:glycosyl transferase family A [Alkalihalophilus pseudofirmus]
MIKKINIEIIDFMLYKVLKTKQKQYLSNLFTQNQKQLMKRIIKPGKKRTQLRKVERIKYRLYNLGFIDRGLKELVELTNQSGDLYLKRLAAWELALWHANQYTKDSAKQCLQFLEVATTDEKDQDILRRATILRAESYEILGEFDKGKQILSDALTIKSHPDLYLAAANLETSPEKRLEWANKALALYDVPALTFHRKDAPSDYDRLKADSGQEAEKTSSNHEPKVSIIIPVYNAESVITTCLDSMLSQTWSNVELLVVDDCSTDDTVSVVQTYVDKDPRVHLIKTETNGGAYIARNHALKVATGEFITINDADDWSHPMKIETQVLHLMKNPKMIGNFSQQARTTEELKFFRRGKPGLYIFANMSSFMFRRDPVMEKVGYWDCVRFAGDSEFVKRIKIVFGEKSIEELPTAPLSFQRQSETSLTGHSAFGFPGFFMGVRKEYAEAHEFFHTTKSDQLRYNFPQKRPFAVPEPMLPNRVSGRRHFDVIIASEFRLLGGTNMSNIEEIKAQNQMGLRTGLIQMSRYDLNSVENTNPKVRELIDGDQVQMLVYGEKVSCDVLIVRHPPILQDWQKYIPDVEAKSVQVIVNQPPKRDYSTDGETLYDMTTCVTHLESYFGNRGQWYPIGPLIRETLQKEHQHELKSISLASEDWVNIINVEEWRRNKRLERGSKIKIGRHSRDQYVKWPAEREELLAIYPDSDPYEIHVLGGVKAPKNVLGELPKNWYTHEFGEMDPKEFLATLDVFVYYTHPDWVEAFGRVIFEAMAVGVPVIIPPNYEDLFGEAAIYAEPHEVKDKIGQLMNDAEYYDAQVRKAHAYVEKQFGYSKHAFRLEPFLHGKQ